VSENTKVKKYHLPLSELIDRLTILEIKLVLDPISAPSYLDELSRIKNDIEIELEEKNYSLDLKTIQILITLGQMNLHIWYIKDTMKTQLEDESSYANNMKLAHQLNGLRNQLKNSLLGLDSNANASSVRTNVDMDGLSIDLGI
jgi:YbbR domain-containing protein